MYIHGDRTRYGQILVNLLTNAMKYTLEGEILITCKIESDMAQHLDKEYQHLPQQLVLQVKDEGAGMTEDILRNLFKDFSKFGDRPGTGLGLSLCKKITNKVREREGGREGGREGERISRERERG